MYKNSYSFWNDVNDVSLCSGHFVFCGRPHNRPLLGKKGSNIRNNRHLHFIYLSYINSIDYPPNLSVLDFF